eukprot:1844689-Amphidinium_carterae.3
MGKKAEVAHKDDVHKAEDQDVNKYQVPHALSEKQSRGWRIFCALEERLRHEIDGLATSTRQATAGLKSTLQEELRESEEKLTAFAETVIKD